MHMNRGSKHVKRALAGKQSPAAAAHLPYDICLGEHPYDLARLVDNGGTSHVSVQHGVHGIPAAATAAAAAAAQRTQAG